MLVETISFPKGIYARYDFQQYCVDRSIAKASAWGIVASKLTTIAPFRTDYELWYKVAANKQTQCVAATAARDTAWDKYEPMLRELYISFLLNNEAITFDEKSGLGIHIHDTKQKTAVKVPVSSPMVILSSEEISVIHVVYSDSNSTDNHAKPYGVAFMEMTAKLGLAIEAPICAADCNLRFNISRNHEAIKFEDTERGKTLFAYSRWVTSTGDLGPWSGMVSGIIP